MNNKLYLLDYTLNIDTLCFKIKNPLLPKDYEKWETSNKKYYQTRRTVKSKINNSSISIRYYPFYKCISIWIESVPCVLYGSSQKMFKKEDFPTLLKLIAKLLNDVTGLSEEYGFNKYSFDKAVITRVDLNHDFYFTKKKYEENFRTWLSKFKMSYGRIQPYNTGGKRTTNSMNITFYSKDEQCDQKHKIYLNSFSDYCTRLEFQFKSGYFNKKENKTLLFDFFYDDNTKYKLVKTVLKRMKLDGEILHKTKFNIFLQVVEQGSKRKNYAVNIHSFYNTLEKYGFTYVNDKFKSSYYNYLKPAKQHGVVPIKLNDNIYRELRDNKGLIL